MSNLTEKSSKVATLAYYALRQLVASLNKGSRIRLIEKFYDLLSFADQEKFILLTNVRTKKITQIRYDCSYVMFSFDSIYWIQDEDSLTRIYKKFNKRITGNYQIMYITDGTLDGTLFKCARKAVSVVESDEDSESTHSVNLDHSTSIEDDDDDNDGDGDKKGGKEGNPDVMGKYGARGDNTGNDGACPRCGNWHSRDETEEEVPEFTNEFIEDPHAREVFTKINGALMDFGEDLGDRCGVVLRLSGNILLQNAYIYKLMIYEFASFILKVLDEDVESVSNVAFGTEMMIEKTFNVEINGTMETVLYKKME